MKVGGLSTGYKKQYYWLFMLNDEFNVIKMETMLYGGKKKITKNGQIMFNEDVYTLKFKHTWYEDSRKPFISKEGRKVNAHSIEIRQVDVDRYELFINDFPFKHFTGITK